MIKQLDDILQQGSKDKNVKVIIISATGSVFCAGHNLKDLNSQRLQNDKGENYFKKIISWKKYFEPYMVDYFVQGGSGADIAPLKNSQVVLAGLRPDSQRYFEYHHSDNDTFEAINKRELELGAAAMTALIHLVDTLGIK